MEAASIGECMVEIAPDGRGAWRLAFAGDTLNTAVYLARFGVGVAYVTALGRDPVSEEMRAFFAGEGLDTKWVLTEPTRLPGLYLIRTDDAGERTFLYWRDRSAARRLLDLPETDSALDAAADARLLYLSGITLSLFDAAGRRRLADTASAVRSRGGHVAFDPNYRARGWEHPGCARDAFEALAPFVSVALPTLDDDRVLYGPIDATESAARWHDAGAVEVVVKQGGRGCLVSVDGVCAEVPTTPLRPVDTTGAGDAFNGAYLAARWHAVPALQAAAFAHRVAGVVVRHPGAIVARELLPDASFAGFERTAPWGPATRTDGFRS